MATKKKDTTKTMDDTVKVPRGIVREEKADGSHRWKASVGSGGRRRTYRFDTLEEAKGYRAAFKAAEKIRLPTGRASLTQLEFRGEDPRHPVDLFPASDWRPIRLMAMLDDLAVVLRRRQKDPTAPQANVAVLKRFVAATMSPDRNWTPPDGTAMTIADAEGTLDLTSDLTDDERQRVRLHFVADAAASNRQISSVTAFAHELRVETAELLPDWLHAQNYSRAVSANIIGLAQSIWALAKARGHVDRNVFEGLRARPTDLPRFDRRGGDRRLPSADAWTADQLVGMFRLLRPCYHLAFWLCVILGLRRSEVFGLRISDWYPESSDLYLHEQRQGSARKGTSSLKRRDSGRPLPVPRQLAAAIDRYIADTHGPAPTGDSAADAWSNQFLIKGAKQGPMCQDSLATAVKEAAASCGVTPSTAGKFRPLHHLRKTLGAHLQSKSYLSGRSVSVLLGHKIPNLSCLDTAARVTEKFYNPVIRAELHAVVAEIESWLDASVLPALGGSDLLSLDEIADPMTVSQAAARLCESGQEVAEDDVLGFVQSGDIRCRRLNFTNDSERQQVLVSGADVQMVLVTLIKSTCDTYSATEVAEILATDHRGVYRLCDEGHFTEVTSDPRRRVSARGNTWGYLPGGGRRFAKAEVDRFAAIDASRIDKLRRWLTIGEAASQIGWSAETTRRLADKGELVMWRDPRSTRAERRVCPDSVREYNRKRQVDSHAEVAIRLGTSEAGVRALIKLGHLEPGPAKRTVLRVSTDDYIETIRDQVDPIAMAAG